MERRKIWQIPPEYQLEIIDLALISNHERLAEQVREASCTLDMGAYLSSENTFSRSVQRKLDQLFANSIEIFSQAGSRKKSFPAGEFDIPCALIIGERSESTDRKTGLTAALRDFDVAV